MDYVKETMRYFFETSHHAYNVHANVTTWTETLTLLYIIILFTISHIVKF